MEQNNPSSLSHDTAGVLPMDTGATVNGNEDLTKTSTSVDSAPAAKKRGRGRPPKSSTGSAKAISDGPKRARGRPPKSSPTRKITTASPTPKSNDGTKKKRGRPAKKSTSNGLSTKTSISNNALEPMKKKRGRPSGSSTKKTGKETNSVTKKKRGRPAGTTAKKAFVIKPKITTSHDGTARKRGRPKKSVKASGSNQDAAPTAMES